MPETSWEAVRDFNTGGRDYTRDEVIPPGAIPENDLVTLGERGFLVDRGKRPASVAEVAALRARVEALEAALAARGTTHAPFANKERK